MTPSEISEQCFQIDFDRAISARFAPQSKRRGLQLQLLFAHELAKIRAQTSDPILRRIRYQFWREELMDDRGKDHPLAKELIVSFTPEEKNRARLADLIEVHDKNAHEPTSPELLWKENIDRQSILFQWACEYLGAPSLSLTSSFFSQCGLAYGSSSLLCKWHGAMPQSARETTKILRQARSAYNGLALELAKISPDVRAGILPLALVSPYLNLFQLSDNAGTEPIDLHSLKKVWVLWRAARKGF